MIDYKAIYKVKQSAKKDTKSNKYWYWSIWIDAEKESLDEISNVEYILHSTFRNRVRDISSRRNKFKLSSKGWGEFTVYIRIYFKNQNIKPLYLSHDLILFSNQKNQQQRVFISSQIKDEKDKNNLSKILENENYIVSSIDTIDSSSNFSESIVDSIDESDAIIVMSSDITRVQEYEIFHALDLEKDVYILGDKINDKFSDIKHINSTEDLLRDLGNLKRNNFT